MTPPPTLSPPFLLYPHDLKSQSALTSQIIDLTNEAFARSKAPDPKTWNTRPRFQTAQMYHDMLVEHAVVAVILDCVDGERKVVACAAAVPWRGGWKRECEGTETGWEIKAIAVDGSPTYLKKGLAVQVMSELERYLVEKTKKEGEKELTLWILAAECINGAYWRKRGYREVRRSTEGDGTWGCKTSFDLVVFGKDVVVGA